jgi:hypothetical protein
MAKKNNTKFEDLHFWRDHFCTDPDSRNDWSLWAEYIEGGGALFDEFRVFLAQVLRGDEKRPLRRPKNTYAKKSRDLEIMLAVYLLETEGIKRDDAVKQAAKHFAVNERTVRRVLERLLPRAIQRAIDAMQKRMHARKQALFERASNVLLKMPLQANEWVILNQF